MGPVDTSNVQEKIEEKQDFSLLLTPLSIKRKSLPSFPHIELDESDHEQDTTTKINIPVTPTSLKNKPLPFALNEKNQPVTSLTRLTTAEIRQLAIQLGCVVNTWKRHELVKMVESKSL